MGDEDELMLQSGGPWDQTGNSVCNACMDKIMYVHYSVMSRYAIDPNYPPNSSTATMDSSSLSYCPDIYFFGRVLGACSVEPENDIPRSTASILTS